MSFGLTDAEWASIVQTISGHDTVERIVLFGSRAMGTHRPGSDVDLAVFGKNLTFEEFLKIKSALDDLELLTPVDLVHFEKITNPDFVDHIERVGVEVFIRGEG